MAADQIEYCGGCEHYAECRARKGAGECLEAADAAEGITIDGLDEIDDVFVIDRGSDHED